LIYLANIISSKPTKQDRYFLALYYIHAGGLMGQRLRLASGHLAMHLSRNLFFLLRGTILRKLPWDYWKLERPLALRLNLV